MQEAVQDVIENDPNGDCFTEKENIFIDSLAAGDSIKVASEKAGMIYVTARRWSKRPDVKQALRERAKEQVKAAISILVKRSEGAARALSDMAEEITDCTPARVSACKAVLELSAKSIEYADLEQRVEQVEAMLAEKSPG